jgi:hypothetical protein
MTASDWWLKPRRMRIICCASMWLLPASVRRRTLTMNLKAPGRRALFSCKRRSSARKRSRSLSTSRRLHSLEQALKVAEQHNIGRSEADVPANELPESELFILGRPMLQARLENLQAAGPTYEVDYDRDRAMLATLKCGSRPWNRAFQTYRYLRTPEEPVTPRQPAPRLSCWRCGVAVGALTGSRCRVSPAVARVPDLSQNMTKT